MQIEKEKITYQLCSNCRFFQKNEDELTFDYCEKCGHLLKNNCPKCRNEFHNPFAEYCKRCGEKLFLEGN